MDLRPIMLDQKKKKKNQPIVSLGLFFFQLEEVMEGLKY